MEKKERIKPEGKMLRFYGYRVLLVRSRNKSKTHDPRAGTKMPSWRSTADGPFGKVQAGSGLPRHKERKRVEMRRR